jgi:hypothetical protein
MNNSTSLVSAAAPNRETLKLSPHQFGKIVDALRVTSSSAGSDKRRFNRMTVEANLSLSSLVDGKVSRCYNALTRDISVNGLGLLQFSAMARGDSFLACLPLGKDELLVKCTTTFCRRLAEGIFGIGAEFAMTADPILIEQRKKAIDAAIAYASPAVAA